MKKNKTAELFLVLLILTVMSVGVFILQNGMEKLQNVKQQSVYVPETRDLYNNYGLKNDQSLSKTKILETQDQVIYTDRIFNINQISEDQISYAADIMKALQEKSGKDAYIMPIPERAVFESGYENEKEKYNNFTEKLEASFTDPSVVLNPLSELEKHQSEYLYFRTKNSWTMRGAFYGAQVIFGELGYDKENLNAYREYVFGVFDGNLLLEASEKYEKRKIRLRIYSLNDLSAKLEFKCKNGFDGVKYSIPISREQALRMEQGDASFLLEYETELAMRLYLRITQGCYRPKTIIDYQRLAFAYPAGDVRITFDTDIRGALYPYGLFENVGTDALGSTEQVLMEVKYTGFLPDMIAEILKKTDELSTSHSKYSRARMRWL